MKYKGVIFDFNGVLWLDRHIQESAWKIYSRRKRGREFTEDEMELHVHGRNTKNTLEYLFDKVLNSNDVNKLTGEKEFLYRKLCLAQGNAFKLSPGSIELFEYLRKKNIKYTIATASGKDNLNFFNKHLELNKWFDLDKIVYDDGKNHGKPFSEVYIIAARKINLSPIECVVIEDSISGIISANNAGIGYVIGFDPNEGHKKLQEKTGVQKVIENLYEFPIDLFS